LGRKKEKREKRNIVIHGDERKRIKKKKKKLKEKEMREKDKEKEGKKNL